MMCYEKSCRLCLKELNVGGIDCTSVSELQDAILKLFEVEILRTDTSKSICNKCFQSVMTFKAFKKTVSECQKIIKDYEVIKKKVMEIRCNTSIKEEIIDLDGNDTNQQSNDNNKRKHITDSDINKTLDVIHDAQLTAGQRNASKRSRISVKNEPQRSDSPIVIIDDEDMPTSSTTTNETTEKADATSTATTTSSQPVNRARSNSRLSSVSAASGIESTMKSEPKDTENTQERSDSSSTEVVTSSVPTPIERPQNAVAASPQPQASPPPPAPPLTHNLREADPPVVRTIPLAKSAGKPPPKKQSAAIARGGRRKSMAVTENGKALLSSVGEQETTPATTALTATPPTPSLTAQPQSTQRPSINVRSPGKINSSIDTVTRNVTPNSDLDENIDGNPRRGRSSRQAKTQALKKFASPINAQNSSVSPTTNRGRVAHPAPKQTESLNGSANDSNHGSQYNSSPLPATQNGGMRKTVSKESANNTQQPAPETKNVPQTGCGEDYMQNGSEKKRVITITLLRTKDSVNFRYCDQFKQAIDFTSVSADELEDIRSSLMIPEIWANLKNVFKSSPPDPKTVQELKTIFGQDFVF